MMESFFSVPNIDVYFVISILFFFGILEIIAGYLSRTKRQFGDWIQEAGSMFVLSLLIKPAIVGIIFLCGNAFLPSLSQTVSSQPFWLLLLVFLLMDDVLQYWYHRSAHEYPFLWKLHRSHHQAEEMGFFISYRNAALYYILMPNIWWVGIFTFLGGANAVIVGLILKQFVIIGSHSTITWDSFFYKRPFLNPIISFLERIIVTPAFHHAHHGKSKIDGISDPNNNFGNMFSIWDQLFGTAVYNRQFPTSYGLENDPKEHWTTTYLYPFIRTTDPRSELSRNFVKEDTRTNVPAEIYLEKGKSYLYCHCGLSKNQPFCDSSHHGTKKKPLLFEAIRTGKARLCNCKKTGSAPFCDDSHIHFKSKQI